MRKFYSLFATVVMAVAMNAQTENLLFNGSDFEDWTAFESSLNSFGLKDYATQGTGTGYNDSNSLKIEGTPTGNDFVFTANAPADLPVGITEITFMVKGTAGKSLSLNLYKATTGYYVYNVSNLTTDKTIKVAGSNQYTGTIDTSGQWVKVTIDLEGKTDYNTDTTKNLFALKVGRGTDYALEIDDIQYVTSTANVIDINAKKSILVKNTQITDRLVFSAKANVKIYNTNGQVVKTAVVNEGTNLDVSSLVSGIYIVAGEVNGEQVSQKIIKK